jgi:hypothetical protein
LMKVEIMLVVTMSAARQLCCGGRVQRRFEREGP